MYRFVILLCSFLISSQCFAEYKLIWQHSDENYMKAYGFIIYDDIQHKYNAYSIGCYEIDYPFTAEKIVLNYIPHSLDIAKKFEIGYLFNEENYGF